jgi:L-ascorbate metabolism protein UlaG (beta-lactamase superfamily)
MTAFYILKTILMSTALLVLETAEQPYLEIHFLGNEAFEITDGQTTLLSDFPYQSGAFGYMTYNEALLSTRQNSTCLITHQHADHFDASLITRIGCKVLGPQDVLEKVSPNLRWKWEDRRIRINDMEVKAIRTPHGLIDHFSYLVLWKNRKLYFVGDTDDPSELLKQTNLDVLFITPWLAKRIPQQKLKRLSHKIVIYHHRTDEKIKCSNCIVPAQDSKFLIN